MSKGVIISSSSLTDEQRGAVLRLKMLHQSLSTSEKSIFIPTIFKKGEIIHNDTKIIYFPLCFTDLYHIILNLIKGLPLSNIIYRRKKIAESLSSFDTVVFHLIRTVQDINFDQSCYVDICESLAVNFKNRSNLIDHPSLKKIIFKYESKRLDSFELMLVKKTNLKKIFISNQDHLINLSDNFMVIPNILIFDRKPEGFNSSKFINNKKIVFLGHVDYEPNLISINNTAGTLNSIDSSIELHVIGSVSKKSKIFLSLNANIILHGFVDDLNSVMGDALCGISIINGGTGMQNKVIDYFQFGLPAIVSDEVQEGLPGSSPAFVCNSMPDIRSTIIKLKDKSFRASIVDSGFNYLDKLDKKFNLR
jgi:hypothetical protein